MKRKKQFYQEWRYRQHSSFIQLRIFYEPCHRPCIILELFTIYHEDQNNNYKWHPENQQWNEVVRSQRKRHFMDVLTNDILTYLYLIFSRVLGTFTIEYNDDTDRNHCSFHHDLHHGDSYDSLRVKVFNLTCLTVVN